MGRARRATAIVHLFRVGVPACLLVVAGLLLAATRRAESYVHSPYPVARTIPYSPAVVLRDPRSDVPGLDRPRELPVRDRFAPGDTLTSVLAGYGLQQPEIDRAVGSVSEFMNVRRVRAGDSYTAWFDQAAGLTRFELVVSERGRLRVERQAAGWSGSWLPFERRVEIRSLHGEIQGSFEQAVVAAGGPRSLAYDFADVFRWDIDFNRDLRRGDRFSTLYELVLLDGQPFGVGEVLAATYETGSRTLEAYRYGEEGGYFDAEGRPVKKMFLRSPLTFSRVTSHFSRRRFHPVLKRYRPHYGVDYGASTGTPVHVTANGTVTFAGRSGGAGNMIKVRHANGYLTAYLHLSRFASGIGPGRRVSQGQVIGYVGATGLATAPHLDYRVEHNGTWIDPLGMKSVPADPIADAEREEFLAWRDALRTSLRTGLPPFPLRGVEAHAVIAAKRQSGTGGHGS